MAKNITGEVLHLDSGLNIMGMKNPMTENIEIDSNITL
jgi:enoyl-[acyl-carrier-protein] reductase (NADH)